MSRAEAFREFVEARAGGACEYCRLLQRATGRDRSRTSWRLFNPRAFESWLLGWHLHFILDRDSGLIVSRTSQGEATLLTLDMNSRNRTFARKLQIDAGLIG